LTDISELGAVKSESDVLQANIRRSRFVALDSWRGICALVVAVHNLQYAQAPSFIKHSFLFVDFFFVLSGFVITHAYMQRLDSRSALGVFLLRRFGRLWPLHVALLIVFMGRDILKLIVGGALHLNFQVLPFQTPNSIVAVLKNVLLIQAIGFHTQLSWNVPSWSISTEFWTYLLFSLICILSPRRPPPAPLIITIVLSAAISIVILVPEFLASNTDYALCRCIYGFFVGHVTYRWWRASWRPPHYGTLLEVSAVILVAVFVCIAGGDVLSMVAPIVFGFTVWVFANENGFVSQILMKRLFVQLGVWSYSIYMVHWLVRGGINVVVVTLSGRPIGTQSPLDSMDGWTVTAIVVGYLIAVVAFSAITYWLIESPGRKYFNSISGPSAADRN